MFWTVSKMAVMVLQDSGCYRESQVLRRQLMHHGGLGMARYACAPLSWALKSQGTGSTAQSRFGYLGGGGDPAFLEMLWSPRLH